jgi:flavodoxin
MNALVVYNSKFGNTEHIARAIGSTLAAHGTTDVRPIGETGKIPAETDLLVIGGPTHAHGMDEAMKTFLATLPATAVTDLPVAAFDTRLKWPMFLSGSAARGITKHLGRLGGQVLVEPGSFLVAGGEGPLVDGEIERAVSWAEGLAEAALRNAHVAESLTASAGRREGSEQ